jgi:hypothetical protein
MRIFAAENLSISVIGHMVLVLIAIGVSAISPEPKIIAPDKIKIISIDLKDVKITGLETKLRNIQSNASKKLELPKKPKADVKNTGKSNAAKAEPIVKEIKVNREVATLNQTMTVSVIDAFRIAMTRCWQIDSDRPELAGIRAVAHIRLFPSGRVQDYWFESATRADTDADFAYVLETIKFAIDACNPFSMMPRGEYDKWKTVQLTFFPSAKVVE